MPNPWFKHFPSYQISSYQTPTYKNIIDVCKHFVSKMLSLMLYIKAKHTHKQKNSSWPDKYPTLGEWLNKYSHTIESRYPLLFKNSLYTTSLFRKTSIICFCSFKEIQRVRSLLWKKMQSENSIQPSFCSEQLEAAHTRSSKNGAPKTLPQEPHSASQHQATIALNCVSICALSRFILCIH